MKFETKVPGQTIDLEIHELDKLKAHLDRENARIDEENLRIDAENETLKKRGRKLKDRTSRWRFLTATPWLRSKGLLEQSLLLLFFSPDERWVAFRVSRLPDDKDEIDWTNYLDAQPSSEFSGSAIITAMERYPDMFICRLRQQPLPPGPPDTGQLPVSIPAEVSEEQGPS